MNNSSAGPRRDPARYISACGARTATPIAPPSAGPRRDPARYMADENLYIVTYDISAPRRWRKVFRIMEGYGEWVQLSVFQCRLTRRRQIELKQALDEVINHTEDHVIIIDVGLAAVNRPRIESLGKPFSVVDRGPVIV